MVESLSWCLPQVRLGGVSENVNWGDFQTSTGELCRCLLMCCGLRLGFWGCHRSPCSWPYGLERGFFLTHLDGVTLTSEDFLAVGKGASLLGRVCNLTIIRFNLVHGIYPTYPTHVLLNISSALLWRPRGGCLCHRQHGMATTWHGGEDFVIGPLHRI